MAKVVFALDDYLKAEKYLYIDSISENKEDFSMQSICHAHKNIVMDKLMYILQKVSNKKTQVSYSG